MPEDQDPRETQEWVEALDSVVEFDGVERAAFLLQQLHDEARRHAVKVPFTANTPYLNTIPVDQQPEHPGDLALEHAIRSLNRWNAVATVLKASARTSCGASGRRSARTAASTATASPPTRTRG